MVKSLRRIGTLGLAFAVSANALACDDNASPPVVKEGTPSSSVKPTIKAQEAHISRAVRLWCIQALALDTRERRAFWSDRVHAVEGLNPAKQARMDFAAGRHVFYGVVTVHGTLEPLGGLTAELRSRKVEVGVQPFGQPCSPTELCAKTPLAIKYERLAEAFSTRYNRALSLLLIDAPIDAELDRPIDATAGRADVCDQFLVPFDKIPELTKELEAVEPMPDDDELKLDDPPALDLRDHQRGRSGE